VGRDDRQFPSRREGLKPIAAAFAVFALLIQALLPSAAMAAQGPGAPLVVCTVEGARALESPPPSKHAPPKGLAGMPCQDCLAASVAALAPPVLVLGAAPVVFVAVEHHAPPSVRLALARAPPRPLGQGPPTA
jgi:hypothetical protein